MFDDETPDENLDDQETIEDLEADDQGEDVKGGARVIKTYTAAPCGGSPPPSSTCYCCFLSISL
jgi:hypothetical protein